MAMRWNGLNRELPNNRFEGDLVKRYALSSAPQAESWENAKESVSGLDS
jgi:hypothetical protein